MIAETAGARHLRSAGVDLDGNIVAAGTMRYQADSQGHFPALVGDQLRLSRVHGMRIVRCRSVREESGFLRVEEYGAELHVPEALVTIINRALRIGTQEPLHASLNHQDGQLSDSTSRGKTRIQPLSDWRLRIDDADGLVQVVISAALHANILKDWNTSTANYWAAKSERDRIEVAFMVDPITRIACFGSYIESLGVAGLGQPLAPVHSTLATLNIETATVGTSKVNGLDGDRWISFFEGGFTDHTIVIGEQNPPMRTAHGFVTDSHGRRGPSIWLHGIDIGIIASLLTNRPVTRLCLTDGIFGNLGYGREEPSEDIIGAELDIALGPAGLSFAYRLQVTGTPRTGRLVLPWELLILRYPALARHRDALWPKPD